MYISVFLKTEILSYLYQIKGVFKNKTLYLAILIWFLILTQSTNANYCYSR